MTLFGRTVSGLFDPMIGLGGPVRQANAIGPVSTPAGDYVFVAEVVPEAATVVSSRRTQPLFGLGLVDAVPDEAFFELASRQAADPDRAGGRPNLVFDPDARLLRVGRFGWKGQVPTLVAFSAEALRDEMGVTNPALPDESCPQGDCALLDFDPLPGLDDDGSRVEALADFMRLLAPPAPRPTTPESEAGAVLFREIGCASCHVERLTTGPSVVTALDRVEFAPYSDFLLHDVGGLGDGIEQGTALGTEMRTAPLWGLSAVTSFLHDGRASSLEEAILAHDGQARPARARFEALETGEAALLLAFLRSL